MTAYVDVAVVFGIVVVGVILFGRWCHVARSVRPIWKEIVGDVGLVTGSIFIADVCVVVLLTFLGTWVWQAWLKA